LNFNNISLTRASNSTSPIYATHCIPIGPGNNAISTTKQKTFNGGVDMKADGFGFNLSSQTGFTGVSKLTYNILHDTYLCGQYNPPNYDGTPTPGALEGNDAG
jgi:hypothetical protein